MTIEIVDFPIENGGSFHSFLYVYQRVTINHGLTPPMENGFQMGLPLVYLTPFMLMGIPWNNGISPSTLRHHGLTPPMDNGIPNNNGIFPSTMGDLQVMSGDVDSLVQVVSQAENSSFQELFPSSQVPLECCTCMMLYGISLKSESSKLHQASKLEFCVVGVFFFDDCWILTGQLWDVGWLWWLNWKSHTIPTIPWVSSEFLQVYHQFREFRYSLFQESLAAESDSSDLTLIVQRVGFSMTRTAPFFSPWLFWWPSLRFRAPLPDLPLSRVSRGRLLMAWPILGPWSLHNIID